MSEIHLRACGDAYYRVEAVLQRLDLRRDQLRRLLAARLLPHITDTRSKGQHARFSDRDIAVLTQAAALLRAGLSVPSAVAMLRNTSTISNSALNAARLTAAATGTTHR